MIMKGSPNAQRQGKPGPEMVSDELLTGRQRDLIQWAKERIGLVCGSAQFKAPPEFCSVEGVRDLIANHSCNGTTIPVHTYATWSQN